MSSDTNRASMASAREREREAAVAAARRFMRRAAVGGAVVAVGFAAWLISATAERRRAGAPSLDATRVVESRVVSRERCAVLQGHDVVVRHVFTRSAQTRSSGGGGWWRAVKAVFSDEEAPVDPDVVAREAAARRQLRTVEHQAVTPKSDATLAQPPGTDWFATMTIERSADAGSGGRSLLQTFADAATEQSVVRCREPRGGGAAVLGSERSCVADVHTLAAPYLRVMLGAFGLMPLPLAQSLRVCQIGAGGGALPMFLQGTLGHRITTLDVVDVEPRVLAAATTHMGLTNAHPNSLTMRLVAADGLAFVRSAAAVTDERRIDALFVDTYVGAELPQHLTTVEFARACRDALSAFGVAAFNMPTSAAANDFAVHCRAAFGADSVFVVPCPQSSNVVVLAARSKGAAHTSRRQLRQRATAALACVDGMPFSVGSLFPVSWMLWA